MRSVFMVIGNVLTAQPLQMSLMERNDMIQHLPAAAAHPSLGDSVLPGTPDARPNRLDPARLQKLTHLAAALGVAVESEIAVGTGPRQGLPPWLYDPIAGRVRGGIEVKEAAPLMFDDEAAIKPLAPQGGHREEVERRPHRAVIVQEGQPTLGLLAVPSPLQTLQITRDGGLGDLESELKQLAMHAGCAPRRIFRFQAADQLADFRADLRTSALSGAATQTPKQPEAQAMPGHPRVCRDEEQGIRSVGPPTAECPPEQSIQGS